MSKWEGGIYVCVRQFVCVVGCPFRQGPSRASQWARAGHSRITGSLKPPLSLTLRDIIFLKTRACHVSGMLSFPTLTLTLCPHTVPSLPVDANQRTSERWEGGCDPPRTPALWKRLGWEGGF